MTSVTIKTAGHSVTIEVDDDDMTFTDFMENVIAPAVGTIYSHELMARWMSGDGGLDTFGQVAGGI